MFTPLPDRQKPRHAVRRATRLAISGSLSVVLVASLTTSAGADDDQEQEQKQKHEHHVSHGHGWCEPRIFFKRHWLSPRNFFVPRTRFIDGPGGTMTVSVTREHEVLAFLETEKEKTHSVTRTFDTVEVVDEMRKMGLPHLEERHMVFTGHEYSQEISDGMYGNMWYRVLGYRIGWSAWSVLRTCRHVKIDSGIANVPARVEGWRYWETKHPMFKGRIISKK
ncbi:hypothetical protein ACQEVF_03010 [Nonomuraea polychroma]|uniref:hypothetical protein n=1 Tax=Nonomuraea polychroma TaxID=46176 RepID=UPI003D945FE6